MDTRNKHTVDNSYNRSDAISKKVHSLINYNDSIYTGNTHIKDGVEYLEISEFKARNLLRSSMIYGKKIRPCLIRKAIPGEKIKTFTKGTGGGYLLEAENVTSDGDYIIQNIDNEFDCYVSNKSYVDKNYSSNEGAAIQNSYVICNPIHKSCQLLINHVKLPSYLYVEDWGTIQYLEEGSILRISSEGNTLFGINKASFDDTWQITNRAGYKTS